MLGPESLRSFLRRRFSRVEVVGLYFTAGVLVCIALAVAFGILADEVFEVHVKTNPMDRIAGVFLSGIRSPGLTGIMRTVTQLGDWRFLSLATPVVALALWWAGHRISALLFAGSVVGGFLVSSALKLAFARARPDPLVAIVTAKTYSFPSGHATMAAVFFGGLVAVAFHLSRRLSVRISALVSGIVFVVTVAVSRVYLGAHWASDTAAGILVGLFWVVVYASGTEYFSRRRRHRAAPR